MKWWPLFAEMAASKSLKLEVEWHGVPEQRSWRCHAAPANGVEPPEQCHQIHFLQGQVKLDLKGNARQGQVAMLELMSPILVSASRQIRSITFSTHSCRLTGSDTRQFSGTV